MTRADLHLGDLTDEELVEKLKERSHYLLWLNGAMRTARQGTPEMRTATEEMALALVHVVEIAVQLAARDHPYQVGPRERVKPR